MDSRSYRSRWRWALVATAALAVTGAWFAVDAALPGVLVLLLRLA